MVPPNKTQQAGYALGTSLLSFEATRLPRTAVGTRAKLDAALAYRESLCRYLDAGPVVASFLVQEHYLTPRDVRRRAVPVDSRPRIPYGEIEHGRARSSRPPTQWSSMATTVLQEMFAVCVSCIRIT